MIRIGFLELVDHGPRNLLRYVVELLLDGVGTVMPGAPFDRLDLGLDVGEKHRAVPALFQGEGDDGVTPIDGSQGIGIGTGGAEDS